MAADQPGGRAAPWREITPPLTIQGLTDILPATRLELSRAWLARVAEVRRNREVLQASGLLDGLSPAAAASRGAALTGTLRIPVIPVHYADVEPPFSTERLEQRLFGHSVGDTVSYADYWREVSGGLLKVEGEVAPWIGLAHPGSFYLTAEEYGWARFGRVEALRLEALQAADSAIDFSQFDNDGPDGIPNSGDDDGSVDFVAFLYALPCPGDARTGAIWPHRAAMRPVATADSSANGGVIEVIDYVILPAIDLESCGPLHIGLFAHETGHALGLPDLYDYDGSSHGIGDWGLMGTGSHGRLFSPAHLSAWEKEQLGWVRVEWLDSDTTQLRIAPVERDRTVYRYDANDGSGRYLLLENRQRIGSDRKLPGHGLLAWHVDPDRGELGIWNRDERRTAVGLAQSEELTRTVGMHRADARDPLPGIARREDFRWTVDRDFALADIEEDGDVIRLNVSVASPLPSLLASTSVVHMTGITGGVPARHTLSLEHRGERFAVTPVADAGWLTSGGTDDDVELIADPSRLAPGLYLDTLHFVDGLGNDAARVLVIFEVVAPGTATIIAGELPWGWGLAVRNGRVLQASYGRDPLGQRPRPRLLEVPEGSAFPVTLARLPADAIYAPVADDENDEAFVIARADDRNFVYRVDARGNARLVAGDVGDGPLYGAALLPDGTLLVAEYDGAIHRVMPDGRVAPYTKLPAKLYQIAADGFGNVYAATLTGNVLRVSPDGRLTWLETGFEEGRLVTVATSADGFVYAAERGGEGRIIRFNRDGSRQVLYRDTGAQFFGLAIDGDFLYALDLKDRQLIRLPVATYAPRTLLAGGAGR